MKETITLESKDFEEVLSYLDNYVGLFKIWLRSMPSYSYQDKINEYNSRFDEINKLIAKLKEIRGIE